MGVEVAHRFFLEPSRVDYRVRQWAPQVSYWLTFLCLIVEYLRKFAALSLRALGFHLLSTPCRVVGYHI